MNQVAKNIVTLEKKCLICETDKPLSEFYTHPTQVGGYRSLCKSCFAETNRLYREQHEAEAKEYSRVYRNKPENKAKRKEYIQKYDINHKRQFKRRSEKNFGLTFDQLLKILDSQNGLCANRGCGTAITFAVKGNKPNRAVLDHDHETGKFRALLCPSCNHLEGKISKDVNRTLGLMEYVQKHKGMHND